MLNRLPEIGEKSLFSHHARVSLHSGKSPQQKPTKILLLIKLTTVKKLL